MRVSHLLCSTQECQVIAWPHPWHTPCNQGTSLQHLRRELSVADAGLKTQETHPRQWWRPAADIPLTLSTYTDVCRLWPASEACSVLCRTEEPESSEYHIFVMRLFIKLQPLSGKLVSECYLCQFRNILYEDWKHYLSTIFNVRVGWRHTCMHHGARVVCWVGHMHT